MGQRVHVGRVNRHHGVEQKRKVNALGFDGELERLAVAIERPRAFGGCQSEIRLVSAVQEPVFERAVGGFVNNLNRPLGDEHHGHHAADHGGLKSRERVSGLDVF